MRLLSRFAILVAFFAASLTAAAGLPTPESVLGFGPGADFKLATYEQSVEYFKKLAAATKQRQDRRGRQTSQGRPMYFALVSSPANLTKIDRLREIARRLAHPQGLSEAEASADVVRGHSVVSCQ